MYCVVLRLKKNLKVSYTHLRDLRVEQATAFDGDIRPAYSLDELLRAYPRLAQREFCRLRRSNYCLSLPRSQPVHMITTQQRRALPHRSSQPTRGYVFRFLIGSYLSGILHTVSLRSSFGYQNVRQVWTSLDALLRRATQTRAMEHNVLGGRLVVALEMSNPYQPSWFKYLLYCSTITSHLISNYLLTTIELTWSPPTPQASRASFVSSHSSPRPSQSL